MNNEEILALVFGICLAISLGVIIFLLVRSRNSLQSGSIATPMEVVNGFKSLNNIQKSQALKEIVNEVDRIENTVEKMESAIGRGGSSNEGNVRMTQGAYVDDGIPEYGERDDVRNFDDFAKEERTRVQQDNRFDDDKGWMDSSRENWEQRDMTSSRPRDDWEMDRDFQMQSKNDNSRGWGDKRNSSSGWGEVRNVSSSMR